MNACLAAGIALGLVVSANVALDAQENKAALAKTRCFEMRTYIANAGKMDALNARFRDHTTKLFAKHGIEVIGFWTPIAGESADHTLVYLLAYPSQEAAEASWKAFRDDPDWKKAKAESEKAGGLVKQVISTYLKPTDYSPMR